MHHYNPPNRKKTFGMRLNGDSDEEEQCCVRTVASEYLKTAQFANHPNPLKTRKRRRIACHVSERSVPQPSSLMLVGMMPRNERKRWKWAGMRIWGRRSLLRAMYGMRGSHYRYSR
ncbi:hypothetical protein JR316_0008718 [Psilocybe cubensis]|uniref:Uncharacterized protein n=1 Tax=Psilocybe cubensis TaxID=181762 RepID=A0ACB8GTF1_PSICU|nr:hypothetical protein JR316_0008718 [Psilocybe cubensis]KAH9478265.1 hypothetical protein JR316_0008718 [Psilocybe cubensis]